MSAAELKLNYLRPVLPGNELRAVAQAKHAGSSLLVSSAIIHRRPAASPAAEEVAAGRGLGTFSRYSAAKRQL